MCANVESTLPLMMSTLAVQQWTTVCVYCACNRNHPLHCIRACACSLWLSEYACSFQFPGSIHKKNDFDNPNSYIFLRFLKHGLRKDHDQDSLALWVCAELIFIFPLSSSSSSSCRIRCKLFLEAFSNTSKTSRTAVRVWGKLALGVV